MTLPVLDIRIPDTAHVVDRAGYSALVRAFGLHTLPGLNRVPLPRFSRTAPGLVGATDLKGQA